MSSDINRELMMEMKDVFFELTVEKMGDEDFHPMYWLAYMHKEFGYEKADLKQMWFELMEEDDGQNAI